MYWYKFVNHDVRPAEDYFELPRVKMFLEADKGNLSLLKEAGFATPDPWFMVGGWHFTFIDNLKEYWVKFQWPNGGSVEIKTWYALAKKDIRANFQRRYCISPRNIIRIMEVPNAR